MEPVSVHFASSSNRTSSAKQRSDFLAHLPVLLKENRKGGNGKKKERGRLHTLAVPGCFSLVSCPSAKLDHGYSI